MSRLRRSITRILTAVAIPVGMAAAFAFPSQAAASASSATARPDAAALVTAARVLAYRDVPRLRAYRWAVTQKGHPYVWGGTGPGYDCSGLVMMAYWHAGIRLPRTTFEMLASPMLVRVIHPRMGDLAFYGTGHVELFRRWGYTFGAHDYGTTVGLIHYGWGWKPTAFYRVRARR
jgi:cell wall-associated NlpC family hydrolase